MQSGMEVRVEGHMYDFHTGCKVCVLFEASPVISESVDLVCQDKTNRVQAFAHLPETLKATHAKGYLAHLHKARRVQDKTSVCFNL